MQTRTALPELLPARMLNEFVYCPRLGFLEWVEGEFADNQYTEDGRYQHRRVDRKSGFLEAPPEPEDAEAPERPQVARSVMMSAPVEGLIARMDLVEATGAEATPVDYKRGKVPNVPANAYDPERVQLCAQGLILRENGFVCRGGWLYFAASRRRVWVEFEPELVEMTRQAARDFRRMADDGVRPPPLHHSPKCGGCSLSGICLPDEIELLRGDPQAPESPEEEVRRLMPARNEALPLYLQRHGLSLGLSGETLQVREKGEQVAEIRLLDLSQINLMGNIQITTQAVRELCSRGIPVSYFSFGGWFSGMTQGPGHKNILLRQTQFRAAFDPDRCCTIARELVAAKILNCRTMLRRNLEEPAPDLLVELKELAGQARRTKNLESLLGVEGYAGRLYFGAFPGMFKKQGLSFDFQGRNRRPPLDPVNAMLSFAYSLLTRDLTITLQSVGFDPFQGYYHQPRYGRPALALDLMEPFRPLIADSTVLWCLNNGVIGPDDFVTAANACNLSPSGRKSFIQAYERRMDELITHPTFGYRLSYRQLLEVQSRLFGRYLAGEVPEVPTIRTR
ncbi:MAG: CRISPR-associated endonuclease Cas4g/Cas1g [Candidatus Xenobium sp.]|jgi:CRISPR-associated protein Cas1